MSNTLRDPSIAVSPGQVLGGKFRVERVLGEGGMGVVVAATHLTLGQVVALKFMLTKALDHPEAVARFEREARASVRLKSEHVARVSDVGRLESGAPYIVMEYLEGDDLDHLIARDGPLRIETAVDYLLQACEAVAEAHALGIVHRDLKPKNLFLTRRASGKPLVKVLDFGISKSTSGDDMSLTTTSQIMGSPNYMSPEQLRSARDVDLRTDIWALGAILFELVTGNVPFVAENVTQLTSMVIQDAPAPMSQLRVGVPAGLEAVVLKCLSKRPEDRYQSVTELATALAPFASAEGNALVQDIFGVSGRPSTNNQLPPEPHSVRVVRPGASTNSAWDRTQLAMPQRRGVAIALLASMATAGAAVAIWMGVSGHHGNVVDATALPLVPPSATASASGPASSATGVALLAPSGVPSADAAHAPDAAVSVTVVSTAAHVPTAKPKTDAGAASVAVTQPPPEADAGAKHIKAHDLPTIRN